MKIDLHVHTAHSRKPAVWLLKKLGCPESFTDPLACYHALRRMGMGLVTFTDHNTIDGCLEIAHLPDTFISEEITAYFPEDQCKVHVLAYGIDERIHAEIQRVRENIYDLVAYLRSERVTHAIAHAFSAVNDRFTVGHFEKLLLLFKIFELNGDQIREVNDTLRHLLATLTPEEIARLAERHQLEPCGEIPWRKALISGSDDHSATGYGLSFTRAGGVSTREEFFAAVESGRATVSAGCATGRSFARNIYSVAYQYIKKRFNLARFSGGDVLLRFADTILEPNNPRNYGLLSNLGFAFSSRRSARSPGENEPLTGFIRREAARLIRESEPMRQMLSGGERHYADDGNLWFEFVNKISNVTLGHLAKTFFDRLSSGQLFDLFHVIGSAGSLYLMLAPYFVSYPFYAAERRLARRINRSLRGASAGAPMRLACFADSYHGGGSVARSVRRSLECALAQGLPMTVVACGPEGEKEPGVRNFVPVHTYDLSELPGTRLTFPPPLELLDYSFEQDFDFLLTATPGPAGLAALLVSKILGIRIGAIYHAELAESVLALTEDKSMSDLAWKYLVWFYNQMDVVLVGSRHSLEALKERGVTERKLRICPRGVDCAMFLPEKRSSAVRAQYGCAANAREAGETTATQEGGAPSDGPLLVYAGNLARESGMEVLLEAFRLLRGRLPQARLVLCGEGAYREELSAGNRGEAVIVAGALKSEERAALYASADVFILPKEVDGCGQALLEAQAAGLPVAAVEGEGVRERLFAEVTGRLFPPNDAEALARTVFELATMPQPERAMISQSAHKYAAGYDHTRVFAQMWELCRAAAEPVDGLPASGDAGGRVENELPGGISEMVWRGATAEVFGAALTPQNAPKCAAV